MTHTDPAAEYETLHGEPVQRRYWCWRRHRWIVVTVVVIGKAPKVQAADVELLKEKKDKKRKHDDAEGEDR